MPDCTWPFPIDPDCGECQRYEHRWQVNADMVGKAVIDAHFTIHGEPVSKARPRFTRTGATYTPATTVEAERAVRAAYQAARIGSADIDPEARYSVDVVFTNGNRRRRDLDNMVKLVLDALNGVAWADDVQVSEIRAAKVQGQPKSGRTEVNIWRLSALKTLTT